MKTMKSIFLGLAILVLSVTAHADQKLKPFILAYTTKGAIAAAVADVKQKLNAGGFEGVGSYRP